MKRFPFIKQKDSMQCGVACLASICEYYGKKYSTQFISKLCSCTPTGISLQSLKLAAEQLGFNSMCVRIPKDSILECNLPCILHWNQNHFVVLYKIESKQKKYYICNPSKGLSMVNDDEFTVSWLSKSGVGIALLLEPTEKFGLQKEVMTTNRHSLSFILKYLKEYRKYLFQIFLGLLFGCVLQLILPFLTQAIVDIGIKKNDIDFILLVLLGELVIILSKASIDFIRRGCDIGAGDA